MSSDSDDAGDLPRSASMRASLKRDLMASPAKLSSPLVTQAARRQLRGNKGERKSAAQVASELRAKEAAEERQGEEANGRPDTRAPGAAAELASKGGEAASRGGERVVIVRRRAAAGSASALTPGGNVGIGVKFTQARDGSHVITSLLPGGPAESTGQVRIGSSIEAVDGQRLRGRPSEQVIDAILGPPGGLVELALLEPPAPPPASPPATPASPPASPPRPSLAAHGASSTDGVRVGVGIRFAVQGHAPPCVTVLEVAAGSPAAAHGNVRPGDTLIAVDGRSVAGLRAGAVEALVAGEPDSTVALELLRGPEDQQHRVVLRRDRAAGLVASPRAGRGLGEEEGAGGARRRAESLEEITLRDASPAPPWRSGNGPAEPAASLASPAGRTDAGAEPGLSKQLAQTMALIEQQSKILREQDERLRKLEVRVAEQSHGCACAIQ